jgi:transcriptional regulator with XRE-family HTH domain
MADKLPHPVIKKLKAWRGARGFSQSQATNALVQAGVPVALTTLQQWEIARSFPRPLMVTALERFLADEEKVPPSSVKRSIAPVIGRLKAWRERNKISQAQAVKLLQSAGLPARLKTLQAWESGRNSPHSITAVAIERFLDEQGPG